MIRTFGTCGNGEIQLNLLEKCNNCKSDNCWQLLPETDGNSIVAECILCNCIVRFKVVRQDIGNDDELTRQLENNILNI